MLAYAANRPVVVDRRPHPNAMLFIIGAHVAVAAAVMSAKMDLPRQIFDPPPKIFWVPRPKDPPPPTPIRNTTHPQPGPTVVNPTVPVQPTAQDPVIAGPTIVDPGPIAGAGSAGIPPIRLEQASSGPQLLTPASELKPPYPASKLLNEEEATLRLRLTIDDRGRVIAVDPVGRTDPAFLEAARRHLIAHWRYKPAIEDGQAVTSSAVITLRFQLDG